MVILTSQDHFRYLTSGQVKAGQDQGRAKRAAEIRSHFIRNDFMKLHPKNFKLTKPTIIERKRFYQVRCEMSLVGNFKTNRRRGYRKK